jgi:vitellogenic carboxypeptidase-like protein
MLGCPTGATDIQDGVASNEAWIYDLEWEGKDGFYDAPRHLLHLADDGETLTEGTAFGDPAPKPPGRVVGYQRSFGPLTHVALRNAGHMAPHDQPDAARAMFESWLHKNVIGEPTNGAGLTKEGEWVAVAA